MKIIIRLPNSVFFLTFFFLNTSLQCGLIRAHAVALNRSNAAGWRLCSDIRPTQKHTHAQTHMNTNTAFRATRGFKVITCAVSCTETVFELDSKCDCRMCLVCSPAICITWTDTTSVNVLDSLSQIGSCNGVNDDYDDDDGDDHIQ